MKLIDKEPLTENALSLLRYLERLCKEKGELWLMDAYVQDHNGGNLDRVAVVERTLSDGSITSDIYLDY